jgi:hypothetical protein
MPAVGITPGDRECHDAQKGHLRVDFVYPGGLPRPFALEITAIVASEELKGTRASMLLAERLSKIAEEEGLGGWFVVVRTDRDMRLLEQEIIEIIRKAQPQREQMLASDRVIRPGYYTPEDLLRLRRDRWDAYIAEHDRLKELGLEEVKPVRGKKEHFVYVGAYASGLAGLSFDEELRTRVEAKASVLAEVEDLERHLAVLVHRWDVSNDPEDTAVPSIPPTLDVLWVVHRWKQDLGSPPVWVARRGEETWRVLASS